MPVVVVAVGAWSHRWVAEDAFIDFRVVGNLLSGHGPVYNVGERVEAYTDPLWVAILTVFRGVLPFVSVEWWSVVLGLACTVIGFAAGGRAAQRLGACAGSPLVIPVGLLVASVVAGVWDFSTSGLETGLAFGWLGVSWLLMVRVVERRRRAVPAAFVIGLGFLVRPDLGIISVVFLVALLATVGASGWAGPTTRWRRWIAPVVAALVVPVVYELFRMSYFGLLVPNTALAKSASSTWWSQGANYLRDFEGQYWLWIPFLCLAPVVVVRIVRWMRSGHRVEAVVLLAPAVGGLLSATYVVAIGGDFMHARMLLPGFFCLVLTMWVAPRRRPDWTWLAGAFAVAWCVTCLVAFRPTPVTLDPQTKMLTGVTNNIDNERSLWVAGLRTSASDHPCRLSDCRRRRRDPPVTRRPGVARARRSSPGRRTAARDVHRTGGLRHPPGGQQRSSEPVIANLQNIGIRGVAAGSDVYLFDELSLANPIGSHFRVLVRTRPGHEKIIGLDSIWRGSPPQARRSPPIWACPCRIWRTHDPPSPASPSVRTWRGSPGRGRSRRDCRTPSTPSVTRG